MNWIDDRLKQRQTMFARSVLIERSAEQIFNDLWDEISKWIEDAKKKNVDVCTNGTPYERIVTLRGEPPYPGQEGAKPKTITLGLARDKAAISVKGIHNGINLVLDVCDDNVVCLIRIIREGAESGVWGDEIAPKMIVAA